MNKLAIEKNLAEIYMQLALVFDPTDKEIREILKSVASKIALIRLELEKA